MAKTKKKTKNEGPATTHNVDELDELLADPSIKKASA